jgi:hypothetical protein
MQTLASSTIYPSGDWHVVALFVQTAPGFVVPVREKFATRDAAEAALAAARDVAARLTGSVK